MRLKLPQLKLEHRLLEFDDWVTPSLGEIKDTDKFSAERELICCALDALGKRTKQFASLGDTSPQTIAESIIEYLRGKNQEEATSLLLGVFSLFFLVTGKSDNNCKCQFPVYLRDTLRWDGYPKLTKKNGNTMVQKVSLPRVIDDSAIAKTICSLADFPDQQLLLLTSYTEFILNEDVYLKSFWALGNTYFRLKKDGLHKHFLMPMVIYRVRGSVSASGGHQPEAILRERMSEWGLLPDIDYNTTDVVVGKQVQNRKKKTRAYDFVLPHNVEGWEPRVFVQCQFYAGDSGSVSHKNVDQIRASRDFTKKKFTNAFFAEYVDGAGYFASLNGDLRRILEMRDTAIFFQVRTSVIKLRSMLQKIGFLTPLEVAHACSMSAGAYDKARASLSQEGYKKSEIDRVVMVGLERGIFNLQDNQLQVLEPLNLMARRYLLLDFIAVCGKKFNQKQLKGVVLIPGFGSNYGITLSEIADTILPRGGLYGEAWSKNGIVLKDIEFLAQMGWVDQR